MYLIHKQNCLALEHLLFIPSHFDNFLDVIYTTSGCRQLHKPCLAIDSSRVGYNMSQGGLKIRTGQSFETFCQMALLGVKVIYKKYIKCHKKSTKAPTLGREGKEKLFKPNILVLLITLRQLHNKS